MTRYLVYRRGNSNAFNSNRVVGTFEAKTRAEAVRLATETESLYSGQYFVAKPQSKCSRADHEDAAIADINRESASAEYEVR